MTPLPRKTRKSKDDRPRAWNSTLPLPTKRIARSGKPKAVNVEATAKRRKRQRSKHAKYMRSETRKLVEVRSGGICEALVQQFDIGLIVSVNTSWMDDETGLMWLDDALIRCQNAATDHHHITYARYGGDELPDDVRHVCKRCHAYFESLKPTRAAHRSASRLLENR